MSSDLARDEGPVALPFPVLTDEELFALGGVSPLVTTPYLDGLDATARDVAQCVALRSLLARGAVAGLAADASGHGATARVDASVARLLDLRAGADTVVAIRRTLASNEQVHRFVHLRDVGGGLGGGLGGVEALVEDVDGAGFHRFEAPAPPDLAAAVTAFLVPAGAVAGRGVHRARDVIDLLAEAHVVADVVVRRRGDRRAPVLRQIYLGPRGCYRNRQDRPDGQDRPDRPDRRESAGADLILEPIDPAEVADWVLALTPMRGCVA